MKMAMMMMMMMMMMQARDVHASVSTKLAAAGSLRCDIRRRQEPPSWPRR